MQVLRSLCSAQSSATFFNGEARTKAAVQDISLSHFSCLTDSDAKILQRYADVVLQINGIRFFADCAFMTERATAHGRLCVFAFMRKSGGAGLDDSSLFRLRPKLYQMVTQSASEELKEAFTLRSKLLKSASNSSLINTQVLESLCS